jgi:hypothetical protein
MNALASLRKNTMCAYVITFFQPSTTNNDADLNVATSFDNIGHTTSRGN